MTLDSAFERTQWRQIAVPACLSSLARLSMGLTDLAFLGHLGTEYLGASSLANVWMTVVSTFLFFAIGGAISTLCSQAHGAKNTQLVGIWLQIGLAVGTAACAPVAGLWFITADVASVTGFQANTHLAGTFSRYSVIGLWPGLMYNLLNAYFQAQGIVAPGVVVGIAAALLNILLNTLLIYGTAPFGGDWHGLHFIGSPLATSLSNWFLLIGMVVWTMVIKRYHVDTWQPLRWRVIKQNFTKTRMHEFMVKQVVPRSVGTSLEQWQLQVIAILAAHLGTEVIATHNALISVFLVITSAIYGMARATIIRVGHHLGKNNIPAAKYVSKLSFIVASVIAVIVSAIVLGCKNYVGHIFSHDPVVVSLTSHLCIPFSVGYLLASTFFTAMAVLNDQSRPVATAVAFVVGAWLVCVPVAYPLSLAIKPRLVGLWVALVIGYWVTAVIAMGAVLRSDWSALAQKAVQRSEAIVLDELKPLVEQKTPQTNEANNEEQEQTPAVDDHRRYSVN